MLCNNALYPDLYGHYREAKFTQTKHHWWWKANRVFNQLEVTRNHTGMYKNVSLCVELSAVNPKSPLGKRKQVSYSTYMQQSLVTQHAVGRLKAS
jgi:hypothetical protein